VEYRQDQNKTFLLHPTRLDIAQKYMLSMATCLVLSCLVATVFSVAKVLSSVKIMN